MDEKGWSREIAWARFLEEHDNDLDSHEAFSRLYHVSPIEDRMEDAPMEDGPFKSSSQFLARCALTFAQRNQGLKLSAEIEEQCAELARLNCGEARPGVFPCGPVRATVEEAVRDMQVAVGDGNKMITCHRYKQLELDLDDYGYAVDVQRVSAQGRKWKRSCRRCTAGDCAKCTFTRELLADVHATISDGYTCLGTL